MKFGGGGCLVPAGYRHRLRRVFLGRGTSLGVGSREVSKAVGGSAVKIGCASGFWGDTTVAAPQLIYGAKIDFLVFDYLSEITMSLLTVAKRKSSDMGYAPDFVQLAMAPFIKDIKKKGIRVVSNAGGINPHACAAALQEVCKAASVDMDIAVVVGDNLMPHVTSSSAFPVTGLEKMGIADRITGVKFPQTVHSMNAYLGAGPIVQALNRGADVVITGRCVDSAVVLGPIIHTFKWQMDNFDLLAAGRDDIGFPIIEFTADGSFVLTKPLDTGGTINRATVGEQMLYELADPSHYYMPDVTCDFTQVQLRDVDGEKDRVAVTGAKGKPPSKDYKVSATYAEGYRSTAVTCIAGPRSEEKARKTAEQILKRCRRVFRQLNLEDFNEVNIEVLGTEQSYGPHARLRQIPRELVLWLAVHHENKRALEFFSREIASAGTGMAPGLTTLVGGRPKVTPVLKLFTFMYPKEKIDIDIFMNGKFLEKYEKPDIVREEYPQIWQIPEDTGTSPEPSQSKLPSGTCKFRLEELAYTRSGDKGNIANIGVIARHPTFLPYLKQALTLEVVEGYFSHLYKDRSGPLVSRIQRFDVPGIYALNFVLYNCLGGGGIASLRSDPQGKALGQMLLDIEISDVPDLLSMVRQS